MSYRIYVHTEKDGKKYQCLGNNECPEVLIEELKKQGCEMDEDNCFENFEIKELEPIIEGLEKYIEDTNNWHLNRKYKPSSIADFSNIFEESKMSRNGLTWKIQQYLECGYLFVTVNFLKAIEDAYEEILDFENERHNVTYKIAEGKHIYMSGF